MKGYRLDHILKNSPIYIKIDIGFFIINYFFLLNSLLEMKSSRGLMIEKGSILRIVVTHRVASNGKFIEKHTSV